MRTLALRIFALCLCLLLPAAAVADTYLSRDDAVHADFTLGIGLHADGFPESEAHLSDWESFLSRLTLRGSLDGQAFLAPESRIYLDGALQLDGEDKIPFVYDGYHSYRYLISPAFMNDPIHFQMHNFFDFMLKPYFFMELPTNYLALILYPNATYYIADSYYTPVRDAIEEARAEMLAETGDVVLSDISYHIPYERLYELCEGMDYIAANDDGFYRVYSYFSVMLADLYAGDLMTDALSSLEFVLDALDPDEEGMDILETGDTTTYTIGGTDVFVKTINGPVTEITLQLPFPQDYWMTFTYTAETTETGMNFDAALVADYDGETEFSLTMTGEGLPVDGALSGAGTVTAELDGTVFEAVPPPFTLTFVWSRTAAEMPYNLDLTVNWIHPETGLEAISLYFSGALSMRDKSVFKDVIYPQNDFFMLNDMFLQEYKARWAPTIGLYFLPIAMEMPGGVFDDMINYMLDTDILISLME